MLTFDTRADVFAAGKAFGAYQISRDWWVFALPDQRVVMDREQVASKATPGVINEHPGASFMIVDQGELSDCPELSKCLECGLYVQEVVA